MDPPIQNIASKSCSFDGDGHPSLTNTGDRPSPSGEADLAHHSPAARRGIETRLWQPRQHSRHLFKSGNGTWYFRLAVPAAIRVQHPELPRELKRSTETANKRVAEACAREICIEFSISYTTGASMPTPDISAKNSFSIIYNNGPLGLENFRGAFPETLSLMSRCMQLMALQIRAQSARHTDAPISDGTSILHAVQALQSNSILVPPSTPNSHSVAPLESGITAIWLSDAIENWRKNGISRFSQVTWGSVYSPSFRVFREIVGNQRRDRETADEAKEFGILDVSLYQLTQQHMQMLRQCLQELPPNQGKRANDTDAMERIEVGRKKKTKAVD